MNQEFGHLPRCIFCEKTCENEFRCEFKSKIICGSCLAELKDFVRIKEALKLVPARTGRKETRLREDLEIARREIIKLEKKVRKLNKKLKFQKDPPDTNQDIGEEVTFIEDPRKSSEMINDLLRPRAERGRRSINHHSVVRIVSQLLPFLYKKIFQKGPLPDQSWVRTFRVVGHGKNRREADIVIFHRTRPTEIVEVEKSFTMDPFLRDTAIHSLRKEIRSFSAEVGLENVAVLTLEDDEEIHMVCQTEGVRYFPISDLRPDYWRTK